MIFDDDLQEELVSLFLAHFGTRYAQVMNLYATNIALFSCALLSASAPDNTSMSALPVQKNREKLCSPQFPTSRPLKEHTHGFGGYSVTLFVSRS